MPTIITSSTPPSVPPTTPSIPFSGSESPEQIQENFKRLLEDAQREIQESYEDSRSRLGWVILICSIVVLCSICLGKHLYEYENYPEDWTWQMIYFTSVRLCIIAAVFSLLSFCFSILRSYIHVFQQNAHRRTVSKAMPGLFAAGAPYMQKEIIYKQLMDILINFDNAGFITKRNDFEMNNPTIELLKNLINKEK